MFFFFKRVTLMFQAEDIAKEYASKEKKKESKKGEEERGVKWKCREKQHSLIEVSKDSYLS